MPFAKPSRTLFRLALAAFLATCALAQEHPNIQPNAIRDQLAQPAPGVQQPQSAPQPPPPKPPAPATKGPAAAPPSSPSKAPASGQAQTAAKPPAKGAAPAGPNAQAKAPTSGPAPAAAKPPVKEQAKAPAKAPQPATKPAKAPAPEKATVKTVAAKPAKPPVEKPAEEKTNVVRRDPFDTLLTKAHADNAPPENLPPGKAGLIVATLRIDGVVRAPNGMIAIASNSQQRVYFLREGDKLYDGAVERIALDAVSFREVGKDAFGKPLERVVTKRLYPSPGEQQ